MYELLAQAAGDTDWVAVTRELGFPIAIALMLMATFVSMFTAVGFALYRIGVWLAPIIKGVADAHIATVVTLQSSSERQTIAMEGQATALHSLTDTTRVIAKIQGDMQREMTEQRKLHEKVCNKIAEPQALVNIDARGSEVKELPKG